ncbi:hypothetical protein ACLQ24_25840 [Micromonospora sp. DT4]|uniref:hypothetical protein n=1 Tax=Micromonospora sp. DT4 TaxID=3393438 RepID=UPI003CE699DE
MTLVAAALTSGAAGTAASAATAAEPDTAALAASLATQRLTWEPCGLADVSPEDEAQLRLSCATVTVPRDWHNPRDGRAVQVRIGPPPRPAATVRASCWSTRVDPAAVACRWRRTWRGPRPPSPSGTT